MHVNFLAGGTKGDFTADDVQIFFKKSFKNTDFGWAGPLRPKIYNFGDHPTVKMNFQANAGPLDTLTNLKIFTSNKMLVNEAKYGDYGEPQIWAHFEEEIGSKKFNHTMKEIQTKMKNTK